MQIHDRDAHDAVLETLDARRRPRHDGVPLLLRRRRDGADLRGCAATTCRSPATSRSRTRRTCATRCRSRRASASWSRRMRRSSPRCRYRGRPNAPYLVPVTVRFMAAELGIDVDELCAQLAANTLAVYGSFEADRDACRESRLCALERLHRAASRSSRICRGRGFDRSRTRVPSPGAVSAEREQRLGPLESMPLVSAIAAARRRTTGPRSTRTRRT